MSLYTRVVFKGATIHDRTKQFINPFSLGRHLLSGGRWPGNRLNSLLQHLVQTARTYFKGEISYAAGSWEKIDWAGFDVVSVNLYRDHTNSKTYQQKLQSYYSYGKPVAITEFGCCTYEGADKKGALGHDIIDAALKQRRIKSGYVRSEETQAQYLAEMLATFQDQPLRATFVFTFVSYIRPTSDTPEFDLDMASYGIVKPLPAGQKASRYAHMPWEPKEAFDKVASIYADMAERDKLPLKIE